MSITGAQIVLECLKREGVEVVFGYPGGAVLPSMVISGSTLPTVIVRSPAVGCVTPSLISTVIE